MEDNHVREVIAAHAIYCSRVLGLKAGQTAILANGRVSQALLRCGQCMSVQLVGPLGEEEVFMEQDYAMLVQMENSSYAVAVAEALGGMSVAGVAPDDDTSVFRSHLSMKVSSLLRSQQNHGRIPQPVLKGKHRYTVY